MTGYFFTKQQKPIVVAWLEDKFESSNCFPVCEICDNEKNKQVVKARLKAFRAWQSTPNKRKHIDAWVHEWLSKEEQNQLVKHLAGLEMD